MPGEIYIYILKVLKKKRKIYIYRNPQIDPKKRVHCSMGQREILLIHFMHLSTIRKGNFVFAAVLLFCLL